MNKKIDISEDWVKSTIQDFISTSPLKHHGKRYGCGFVPGAGALWQSIIPVKAAREALKKGILPPPPPPLA